MFFINLTPTTKSKKTEFYLRDAISEFFSFFNFCLCLAEKILRCGYSRWLKEEKCGCYSCVAVMNSVGEETWVVKS